MYEALGVLDVEVRGRLVQREDAAVQAERLRERETDHERGQHFLPGAAPPAHVELGVALVLRKRGDARGAGG